MHNIIICMGRGPKEEGGAFFFKDAHCVPYAHSRLLLESYY